MFRRNTLAIFDDELAAQLDVECRGLTAQTLGDEPHLDFFLGEIEFGVLEKQFEHFDVGHSQRPQDDRNR